MSDNGFEGKVLDKLDDLRDIVGDLKTKMTLVVGQDGTGGWMASTDERLTSVEQKLIQDEGKKRGTYTWLTDTIKIAASGAVIAIYDRLHK